MEKEKVLTYVTYTLLLAATVFITLGLFNISSKQRERVIAKTQVSIKTPVVSTTTKKIIEKGETAKKVVSDPTKIQPCPAQSRDFDCFNEYYRKIVELKGVPEAFRVFKEDYKNNSYVMAQCHPFAHVIGHAAVELYPTVSAAFNHGDPFCWSGYYHGVMEEISEKIGVKGIQKEMNNICANVDGKTTYSFNYYNCVHGLGHGVMAVNDNQLFTALNMCDSLTGEWEKQSCFGGVYMENVILDTKGEHTDYLKPEDPLYPCNAVDLKYKYSCYLMQTSYALKVNGRDFAKTFALCRTADNGFQNLCWQSLGRDASGNTSSNAERTKAYCDLGANYEEKSNCVIGAVKDFISYYHSDVEAKAFCSSLSEDLRQVCMDTAISYYKTL